MKEEMTFHIPKTSMIAGIIQYSYLIFFFGIMLVIMILESTIDLLILSALTLGIIVSIYYILLIPYKIHCNRKTITFKSIIKAKTYAIDDIVMLRSSFLYNGFIKFKFSKKNNLLVPSQYTDFYFLINHLKQINPEIINYGC